ncbi:hypothetical protein [Cellulomonas sp. SG140]|uniref:hypothetical protein n=1 Tax=Cellulomonas sp. SG140 TaxID=2976536 RepID=UPI0021E76B1D|nr:hypothetical protein [Cellulomonas sp. SG140]
MKHSDNDIRGFFEHTDRFMARSGIERQNAEVKRFDIGNLDVSATQTMGRARVGFLAAATAGMQSMVRVEDVVDRYGLVDNMPYTPRLAARRARKHRIQRAMRGMKH